MDNDQIKTLRCCCCGGETHGKQWWNRDTGYGLCNSCVQLCHRGVTPEEFRQRYGDQGVHYMIKSPPLD